MLILNDKHECHILSFLQLSSHFSQFPSLENVQIDISKYEFYL